MKEHTFQVLGYYRLLDIVSHYASCTLGQSNCLSLRPSNDIKIIENELRLVSEMRLLLKSKGFISFSGLSDVVSFLEKSRIEGSYLEPEQLLFILKMTEAAKKSKKLLNSERALFPRLYDLCKGMPVCEDLAEAIRKIVSPNSGIRDSASPALKKIRQKKIRLRGELQQRLDSLKDSAGVSDRQHENIISVRDGRYVMSLRTGKKSFLKGIIHGYSQTKATCFIEPVEVIQDNNRVAELIQEEQVEEMRLLTLLTRMVRDFASDLEYIQFLLGKLDGLYARARFAESYSCVMPIVGEKSSIQLKRARNPLLLAMTSEVKQGNDLKQEPPVPVDIVIDDRKNILIVSGPNRGGKTVTLKTLGLLSLMTQAGMHVPAEEGSRVQVFDHIMAEIGDDQDIGAGLSTFSAHASHLEHILKRADRRSLVIIDEPGMGTDPDEGVALAMAVLDNLSEQGAFVAVSTHYNRLKTYGLLNNRAVNASVEFDTSANRPTFELHYGFPGISHGLDVARSVGIEPEILDQARKYLDQDEIQLNRLIEKLNNLIVETTAQKIDAETAKGKYRKASLKLKEVRNGIEEEKKELIESKRFEAEKMLVEAREELKQAINALKKRKSVQTDVTDKYDKVGRKLMDHLVLEKGKGPSLAPGIIKKGLSVYHKKLKQKGTVQSVEAFGERALVMLGHVKVSADISDLEIAEEPQNGVDYKPFGYVSWDRQEMPSRELNLIGYRVDDAIALIDKTIDRALVGGELSLRIVHGYGTGKLRGAIREHLKAVPFVKKVSSAEQEFGGNAITVVELN